MWTFRLGGRLKQCWKARQRKRLEESLEAFVVGADVMKGQPPATVIPGVLDDRPRRLGAASADAIPP
jgi:hypothetical protein